MNTTTAAPRVLIVDDEENIRFLVGSAVQLAGVGCVGRRVDT